MSRYRHYGSSPEIGDPSEDCFIVTPHDTDPLPKVIKAFRADGDGVIVFRPFASDEDVAHPVKDGEIVSVITQYIRDSGTSGQTSIVGYV